MIYYTIWILIFYIIFMIFIILIKIKIEKLEKKILYIFNEKNNQIPSIYEVTKDYLNKHNEIFNELIILKKKDFSENTINTKLTEKTNTYKLIHNELNFIFKVCNKHPKINKNHNFLYVKDIIIEISFDLWKRLELYKKIVKKFNNLIFIKNITIIWLLFPIEKKEEI